TPSIQRSQAGATTLVARRARSDRSTRCRRDAGSVRRGISRAHRARSGARLLGHPTAEALADRPRAALASRARSRDRAAHSAAAADVLDQAGGGRPRLLGRLPVAAAALRGCALQGARVERGYRRGAPRQRLRLCALPRSAVAPAQRRSGRRRPRRVAPAGREAPLETHDPSDIVATVVERQQRAGHDVRFARGEPVQLPLRAIAFLRLVTNLVDNALRHGAPPVEITTRYANGSVVLEVADRGPGIPAEQVERLKRPFMRG